AHRWPTWLRVAAGVGALGALTTFSTLAAEVWTLVDGGDGAGASTYLFATLAGGLAAAVAGLRMGEAAR
ncbi:MAG: CrcB family protein, partial [Acidimicrobiia bacterium]|nr:CrcB family protein [Acidimicrobiia bacterium]